MNKLVREHYPVSNLPEDLREGFETGAVVRITIDTDLAKVEPTDRAGRAMTPDESVDSAELIRRWKAVRRINFASDEEVDDYVRSLRE